MKLEIDEYNSGMKISEIAKAHDRTNGAICARLKKTWAYRIRSVAGRSGCKIFLKKF